MRHPFSLSSVYHDLMMYGYSFGYAISGIAGSRGLYIIYVKCMCFGIAVLLRRSTYMNYGGLLALTFYVICSWDDRVLTMAIPCNGHLCMLG
jgi:hypothetical protein